MCLCKCIIVEQTYSMDATPPRNAIFVLINRDDDPKMGLMGTGVLTDNLCKSTTVVVRTAFVEIARSRNAAAVPRSPRRRKWSGQDPYTGCAHVGQLIVVPKDSAYVPN